MFRQLTMLYGPERLLESWKKGDLAAGKIPGASVRRHTVAEGVH